MFVISTTIRGVSQPLLAYTQISGAVSHALTTAATPTDRSQIYRVANADDSFAAVAAVGLGEGVFVGVIAPIEAVSSQANAAPIDAVRTLLVSAITNEILSADSVED